MMRALFCIAVLFAALSCPFALFAAQQAGQAAPSRMDAENSRREAILAAAVKKAYTPPQPGFMPHPDDIPMSWAWEDPDWDTPLMQSIYKNPYSYSNNLDNYLPCLGEALGGNPKAMLAISMYCYLWGYVLEEQYPDFPPQTHSFNFWREWAERVTNPAWVRLRLGDLHGRWPVSSLDYYRQAAEMGNAEAMFNYYKITGKRRDYLYRSAALGCAEAAFLLGEELEKQGGEENLELAKRYTWLAALNADEWGLLHSSFAFYNGEFGGGDGGNCEQGYLYALLSMRFQHGNAFSSHHPDNICMLPLDAISRLEAAADRWQADYDQRRLPYILRVRYRSVPMIEELQTELAPLIARLGLSRRQAGEPALQPVRPRPPGMLSGLALPWHLGFFSDAQESAAQNGAAAGTYPYHGRELNADGTRYIPWIYAFVLLCVLTGGGFITYSQYQKRRKKQQKKQKRRERPSCV